MDYKKGSPEERTIRAMEEKQERMEINGKRLVIIIAVINILASVMVAFVYFKLPTLIIEVVISIAFLLGISWTRYPFALLVYYNAAQGLFLLFTAKDGTTPLLFAIYSFIVIHGCVSGIVVFISKSVGEYLYTKKHGSDVE